MHIERDTWWWICTLNKTVFSSLFSEDTFQSGFQDFFCLVKGAEFSANGSVSSGGDQRVQVKVSVNHIKQSPLYTLAAIQKGVYVIGMKDQFNIHDMRSGEMDSSGGNPLAPHIGKSYF